jgi:hypothetical protein
VGNFAGTQTLVTPNSLVTVVQNFVGTEISRTFAASAAAACADGIDNDGDGGVDLADAGCASAADTSERTPAYICDDGVDNDLDGATDFDPVTLADLGDATRITLGQGDPACSSPTAGRELTQCQDGMHNDGDGKMDFDAGLSINGVADPNGPDTFCVGQPFRNKEKKRCGLGFELALLLPVLMGARRWRSRPQSAA